MFRKLVAVYREFTIDGRRAEEVVRELIRLSESLGILEGTLEKAIMRAFRTEKMLDVEIAKEIFHGRLKVMDKSLLGDVDPVLIFKSTDSRPNGGVTEAGGPGYRPA
jgi:hypothetical protein